MSPLRFDPDFKDTAALFDHTHYPERGTVEEAYGALNECENCGGTEGTIGSVMAHIRGMVVPLSVCLGCARMIEEGAFEDA